jgi:hypothetical protein
MSVKEEEEEDEGNIKIKTNGGREGGGERPMSI